MRNFDLLALDMDGTLLHSDLSLSTENKKALHDFHEAGGKIFLISGRPDVMTLPYVYEIEDVDLYASYNGAFLGDRYGNGFFSAAIDKDSVKKTYDLLLEKGFSFSLLGKEGMYSNWGSFSVFGKQNGISSALAEKHGLGAGWLRPLEETDWDSPVYKIVIFKKEKDGENEALVEELNREGDLTVTSSRSFMYDVSSKGIDKGLAIRKGREYLHIDKDRVCVMGDYFNDLAMFEEASFSIAMGNAPEEVKKKASAVVSSNEEDGVAEGIRNYLLGK